MFNDRQPDVPGIFSDDLPTHPTRNFFPTIQKEVALPPMVRLTICPHPSNPLLQMVPYLTVHPERLVYLHNACLSLGHPQRAGAKPCTVVVIHRLSRADRCQEMAYTTTTKLPTPASVIKFPIFDIREDMASEIGAFINTRGLLEPMAEL